MSTPAAILADLAAVLLLLRDRPDKKEEQRSAFKRLAAHLVTGDHVVRVKPTSLVWDQVDVPLGRAELVGLHDQLRGHGIGEVRFPVGLMTSTLVSLMKVLAQPPGTYGGFDHLTARLDAAGCGAIPVSPLPEAPQTTLPASAPPAPPQAAPPLPGLPPEPQPLGPGLVRPLWEVSPTVSGERPAAGGRTDPKGQRVDDDGRLADLGPDALTEAKVGMMHFLTAEMRAVTPLDDLVARLSQAQGDRAIGELLNQIMASGEAAERRGDWPEVVRTAHALVRVEAAQAGGGQGRTFGIALRRLLPKSALEQVARLTTHGPLKAEATAVLRRMGADGTEVLLLALSNAEDMAQRRAYFSALKEMSEGTELIVHMLSHDQWFVVRNMADLCGEIQLERAIPALSKLMAHDDDRVRRAVAGALAKMGGTAVVEPMRRALRDPSPAVRMQAAQDLDGRRNRSLAMSLAVSAEEESKPDVQREMYLALGRIGSADALQALKKAAEPGGKLFRRKAMSLRLAAVEGLGLAGPSAAAVLKDLLADDDKEFRAKVEQALQLMWS